MSIKSKTVFHVISLLAVMFAFVPVRQSVSAATNLPPVDLFQLPWDQGLSWVAIDGLDNGSKRPLSSSHNYSVGGAIDFAPHNNMIKGEDTSNFWTTAAAAGTVVGTSTCSVIIDHGNGWVSQYQFLANLKVKLGDAVARNQRLGIIADGVRLKFCPGSVEPDVPHLHFMVRPTLIGVTLAGWEVKYNSLINSTTFTKDGTTLGLFKPLSNTMTVPVTPSPTPSTTTPVPTTTPPGPTVTPPSGPYVSTSLNFTNIQAGETAVALASLNNVPAEGYTSAEFTCTYDASVAQVSNIVVASLFGSDPVSAINDSQNGTLIVAIAGSNGSKATTSGAAFSFDVKGLQAGQTAIECKARVSQGNNVLTDIPSIGTNLTITTGAPTPTFTATIQPSGTPLPTFTPSPPSSDWLTYANLKFGFQFNYPPQGVIAAGNTDNFARIDLPFAQGTNLHEKYLQVDVTENANPCRSPVAASSITQSSSTVTINGISFLKEVGGDAGAGNFWQFVAYSTARDNVCVSLSLVLHSLNPGNSIPTEVPFDYAAEIAVVDQIVATYTWLALPPTATPTAGPTSTVVPTVTGSPAPTFTSTPVLSPTPSGNNGAVAGKILVSKPAIVNVYDTNTVLVATMETTPDGTFRLEVPPGTYTVVARVPGFLRAQSEITLTAGNTTIMPTISLLAGDIDENNVIDQFDALSIGMNYNYIFPEVADLNNDRIINVLDLELLAANYRKTGPVSWQ